MTALFNRVGDRLLSALLPRATAAATERTCYWQCTRCHVTFCVDYYRCNNRCLIIYSGGSGETEGPCPC